MSNFYVGQTVKYKKDGRDIPKGFVTTVLNTTYLEEKFVLIVRSPGGIQIYSYARYWEPVNEKFSEDLFQ